MQYLVGKSQLICTRCTAGGKTSDCLTNVWCVLCVVEKHNSKMSRSPFLRLVRVWKWLRHLTSTEIQSMPHGPRCYWPTTTPHLNLWDEYQFNIIYKPVKQRIPRNKLQDTITNYLNVRKVSKYIGSVSLIGILNNVLMFLWGNPSLKLTGDQTASYRSHFAREMMGYCSIINRLWASAPSTLLISTQPNLYDQSDRNRKHMGGYNALLGIFTAIPNTRSSVIPVLNSPNRLL